MKHRIAFKYLGTNVPYRNALDLQTRLVEHHWKKGPDAQDILLLLQHTPTFTAGRRMKVSGVLTKELGAEYVETKRGGQLTFHGPGQLVGYPILNLKRLNVGVRCYVEDLQQILISVCKKYAIDAHTTKDTGVWVDQSRKIAALGKSAIHSLI